MLLDKLKNSWEYYKKQTDLPVLQTDDILAIIERGSINAPAKKQVLFFNIALLLMLILLCKGG